MTEDSKIKDSVVKAWELAYHEWECGVNTSPSADDLARIANDICPLLRRDAADDIYEAEQDGNDLAAVYDIVYVAG